MLIELPYGPYPTVILNLYFEKNFNDYISTQHKTNFLVAVWSF